MADTAGTAANPAVHTFQATLVRPETPGAWTYLVIPLDVIMTFGERGQVIPVPVQYLQFASGPRRDTTRGRGMPA